MLGVKYIKAQPNTYILQYKKGRIIREGAGLSFAYFSPSSSIVAIPQESTDIPFIFNEVTLDFQEISIQGEITYKIDDPKRLAGLLNFALAANNRDYVSDDPDNLVKRIINQTQVLIRAELQKLNLKEALQASAQLEAAIVKGLRAGEMINQLGIGILAISILAIRPNPETSRALEAEIREVLLMKSDEAIYRRRNAAVEQERAIKENELNTEVAVENKRRQIREARIEADRAIQEKKLLMQQDEMSGKIALEEQNRQWVAVAVKNMEAQADAKAYGVGAIVEVVKKLEPKTLQALASIQMNPSQLIAAAFQNFADNAGKIGNLNIAPELLRELLAGAPSD